MKKTILMVAAVLMIAVITTITIVCINGYLDNRRERIEMINQEKLREAYYSQNSYFGRLVSGSRMMLRDVPDEELSQYMPVNLSIPNVDGIDIIIYLTLEYYRNRTGRTLTYDQVIQYLTEEFEDDGEVRIYTNGRHPEVAAYVEWSYWRGVSRDEYIWKLQEMYSEHASENQLAIGDFLRLPIGMIDALIKKEADPDYEMDLTSIQNRYIAEGRARVSEDGETIKYIYPEP